MLHRLAAVLLVISAAAPIYALSIDEKTPDQQSVDALEVRAKQAPPKEQCFLYAQVVHKMVEFSLRKYADGDMQKGHDLLKHIQLLAGRIHASVSNDDKRLKDTEILLRHTSFRLGELLRGSGSQDSSLVGETLTQVNQAQNDVMIHLFHK